MKKTANGLFACVALILLSVGVASAQVRLNEIRIDHGGADTDEYVELVGPAGMSLAGWTVVVIGDGAGLCGTVEAAIDLSPYSIQADGLLAVRYSAGAPLLAGYDVTLAGSFENSDNLTFLLVTGWSGAVASDLDTNDDGTLDSTPWTGIADQVGLYEGLPIACATGDEYLYTSVVVGPDGTFVPGHIYRCGDRWYIGPFIAAGWPVGALDTPGAANGNCATPTTSTTWGKVKTIYR